MGIWPEQSGPNFLLYQTKVVQYLKEIRDSMGSGFQNIINEGELAEESLRGVCFNILDDSIHRGDVQIIPTIRRVYYAAEIHQLQDMRNNIYVIYQHQVR